MKEIFKSMISFSPVVASKSDNLAQSQFNFTALHDAKAPTLRKLCIPVLTPTIWRFKKKNSALHCRYL